MRSLTYHSEPNSLQHLMQTAAISRRSLGIGLAGISVATSPKRATGSVAAMARIDSHVHVWAPTDQQDSFPFAGALIGSSSTSTEPPLPGYAELLVSEMEAAGVQGAMIVQPGNHMYDHSYVNSVLERYPSKFIGCLLADPTPGVGGVAAIERLHEEHGYRAVRFNPYLWPEGEKMTNEVGRAMYRKAGELGLPVSHMPFKGLLRHIDEIEELISLFPRTRVIVDHFGFCACDNLQSEEWGRLLALARHPQVHVKSSAFFRVSKQPYPHGDAVLALRKLVDAFGAGRVAWGTDWPWVQEHGGYVKAWSILEAAAAGDPSGGGSGVLTREEQEWVMGGTMKALFPGAWA